MTSDTGEFGVSPTESKTTRTVGNLTRGSRETPETSVAPMAADRSEKARCHKSDMHVAGESHSSIVPKKPANKGGVPPQAESAEGRGLTKENTSQSLLDRTQGRNADGTPNAARSRGLWGVRQAAPTCALRVNIHGKNRMRSFCTYGSVRGVARKGHPYRDESAGKSRR